MRRHARFEAGIIVMVKAPRSTAGERRSKRLQATKSLVGNGSGHYARPVDGEGLGFCGWHEPFATTAPAVAKAVKIAQRAAKYQTIRLDLVCLILARAAELAFGLAAIEMDHLPRSREEQDKLYEAAFQVIPKLKALGKVDVSIVGFGEQTHKFEATAAEIVRLSKELQAAMAILPPRAPVKPSGGADVLMREFVRHVGLGWSTVYGVPPNSKEGPYVRILAAAWEDLKWPRPDAGGSIANLIGDAVARNPQKYPKIKDLY